MCKKNNLLKLTLVIVLTIFTFISILSGSAYKIAKTGWKLMSINFDIQLMQEDEANGADVSVFYEKDSEERAKLYNSDDKLINWYANLNGVAKAIIWIADIAFIVFVSFSVLVFIVEIMTEREKEKKRKKRSTCKRSNECVR